MSISVTDNDDIVLGTIDSYSPITPFRLSLKDQEYHATIWGRSGSGKSKELEGIFLQHLSKNGRNSRHNNNRRGIGLIEPHHDLSFDILTYLTSRGFFRREESYESLIYLDWGNGAYVPSNIIAGEEEPYTRALNALDAILRVWPELAQAPTFQTLFLSSVMVLIANQLPITFLYQLLTDSDWRNACLEKVNDPLIHQTFQNYDRLARNQAQEAGSTLRRAFLLSFNPVIRNTLGQPENWLNFRKIMDEGKSFIINLGNIKDPITKKLIGANLMVQIEQAALSRTDIPPSQRTPFTLLIDEWPSFAAQDNTIDNILAQTRKFNLRLYLSAQSMSQLSSDRLAGALENCRLTIAFGLGRDSAAIQARHIGRVDPFAVKEQARTDTQHTQYLSIAEQFESWAQELQNLSPRYAFVKLHDQPAVRIKTLTVNQPPVDPDELAKVLEGYRKRYQRTLEEAERAIAGLTMPGQPSNNAAATAPAYTKLFQ
jgi:hypothetical protein